MRRALWAGLAAGVLLALLLAWAWRPGPPPAPAMMLSLTGLLGGSPGEGFALALEPGAISLPRDHGPQPAYRNEWWYFTGNLEDAAGNEYGFQLTFFRFAFSADPPQRESAWAARDVYMAHFALSDAKAGRHRAVERFGRTGPGGADARGEPFAVWLDDWRAASLGGEFLPLRLTARDEEAGIALDLVLQPGSPPLFNGDQGLSQKGPEPGNASYYYSLPRMPAAGELASAGRRVAVSGQAWLDREWGTSALGEGVLGWDWFGLRLDDGSDLMLYGLRTADGGLAAQSAGTLRRPDGSVAALGAGDFALEPLRRWRSPRTGVTWPVEWRLVLPAEGLELRVQPLLDDQEQDLAVRYWEGAVRVLDRAGGRAGRGYMELVGYRD
jgi:predicted secreted hydrolase